MKNGQKSSLYGEVSPYSKEIPHSERSPRFTIESIHCIRVTNISIQPIAFNKIGRRGIHKIRCDDLVRDSDLLEQILGWSPKN